MKLVKDWMTDEFKIIRGDVSLTEAIALLAGRPYGVVENASQQAIGVVTEAELEGAIATSEPTLVQQFLTSAPLLTVGCDLEMQAVVESLWLKALVQSTKNALVTDDESRVVGILTTDSVRTFIRGGSSQQKGPVLGGDAPPYVAGFQLAGALSPLMAYCICHECWYVNGVFAHQWADLTANVIDSPTCQNPNPPEHSLKLS